MKKKNLLALLLIVAMLVTVFAACSTTEEQPNNSDAGTNSPTPDGGDEGDDGDDGEITEINYWCWDNGLAGQGSKGEMVEEAVNAYVEEKIGVHVNFTWVASADYGTQLTLALANNERIDMADYFANGGSAFAKMQADKSILDITDLAAEYAPDLLELIGEEVLSGVTIDGKLYAIPTYRNLNSNWYLVLRDDILEQAGVLETARDMSTWAEFETVMQAVVESGYDGYPIGGGDGKGIIAVCGCVYAAGENFADAYTYDTLGDAIFSIATDQEGNVFNLAAMEESQNNYKMIKKWYDAGYLYADAAYNTTGARELFGADTFAMAFAQSEFGGETSWRGQSNYEVELKQVAPGYLQTANVQKFGVYFPITGQETEAALRFANLLYTDATLMNLITWGIEGETYQVVDGVASYKDGQDAAAAGYHNNSYKIGNLFLTIPWEHPANFQELLLEDFLNCNKSSYLGLTVDLSEYDTLYAAISSVTDEYVGMMQGGFYSDEAYNEYLSKLDAAGIADWVAIYQSAVDGFMK